MGQRAVRMPDGSSLIFSLFSFEFGGDGTYTFTLGNETKVWASHAGRYSVSAAVDGGSQRYPCLVRLQPSLNTIRRDSSQRINDDPIGFRDLSNGTEATFRFRQTPGSHPLSLLHTSVTGRDVLNDIGSFGLTLVAR